MSFLINTPPNLDGNNEAKIKQLYTHLYQMCEQVNYALNALASGDVVDMTGTIEARKNFSTAIMGGNVVSDTPSLETYNELKSLIIKTGNAIEKSKASIELVLGDEVKRLEGSIGDFQTLIDTVSSKADNNAEAISGFDNQLEGINQSISNTNQSVSNLNDKVDNNFEQTNTQFNERIQEILNGDDGLLSKLDTVNGLIEANRQAIAENDTSIKQSLADEVEGLLSNIQNTNSSLEQKIADGVTSLQGAIDSKDESIRKDLADEVSGLQEDIKNQSEELDKKITDSAAEIQKSVDEQVGVVSGKIDDTNKNFSNFQTQVGNDFDSVDQAISGQGDKINGVENELSQAKEDIQTNKTDISGLKEISLEIEEAFGVNSEYGSYAEAVSNKMSISAKNVLQEYKLVSRLDAADERAAGFSEWINVTDSYIKTGILYTDSETGIEQVGVAIGTNISSSIVDGVVQPDATKTDLLATFVSDCLIFWQSGRKVAYFSNKKLYVLSAEFLGSYRIGDFQWVNADVGLILEWVGE